MKSGKKKRTNHHVKVPVKNDDYNISQISNFIKCEAFYYGC